MKRAGATAMLVVIISVSPHHAEAQVLPRTTEAVEALQNVTPDTPSHTTPPAEPAPQDAPKPKEEAPKHASTGWGALFKDTIGDFKAFPMRRSTWVILGIGGGAALVTHPLDDKVQQQIVGNDAADKFFSLGQWVGSSSGQCCAFPSGHAASAFAAASVLERHLGYRASWPFIAGALYVGASRLVDNQHFLSDVMFGAAVGTASGWTVVGRRHGNDEYAMQPVPVNHGMMIVVTKVPPQAETEHLQY